MIHNERRKDGGRGERDKDIGTLFGDRMGKGILRQTVQEERKRASILPGGINVRLSGVLSSWGKAKTNLTFGQMVGS